MAVVLVITKRYISHGWVKVPKKYRFILEMINLFAMFVSFGFNLALALALSVAENKSQLLRLLLIFCSIQMVVLTIIFFHTCAYWTVGE